VSEATNSEFRGIPKDLPPRSAIARRGRFAYFTLLAVLLTGGSLLFNTSRTMSPVWYGPYLSAAANLSWGGPFQIDLDEVVLFSELTSEQRAQYHFTGTADLTHYNHNPLGFAYVVAGAKWLFPFLSDVWALKALQIGLHVASCLLILTLLQGRTSQILFLVLYGLNPAVIYFVTFPYYYFLQSIPSVFLAYCLLSKRPRGPFAGTAGLFFLTAAAGALGIVLLTRPTTIAAIALSLLLLLIRLQRRWRGLLALAVFTAVVVTGHAPTEKNFWHTAYVGLGAYPNEEVTLLSDNEGYDLFERETGTLMNASLGGNYYDSETTSLYKQISRSAYLRILNEEYPRLALNATANIGQSFSVGFINRAPLFLNYIIAMSGFLVAALLMKSGQYWLTTAIFLTSATFTPYYPPIQAYMFGAFLLLVLGVLRYPIRSARQRSASIP